MPCRVINDSSAATVPHSVENQPRNRALDFVQFCYTIAISMIVTSLAYIRSITSLIHWFPHFSQKRSKHGACIVAKITCVVLKSV